ncbi:MAG: hypothetical protein RMJ98_09125 [Myxococcales bacterium]|nr:hypothetical protein [Polyangiaceae bacterium]MDW8249448.1 hypothetical protein [Myxococcales bacterium]
MRVAWASLLLLSSCFSAPPTVQEREAPATNASISPNASILPAPLASTLPAPPASSGLRPPSPRPPPSARTPLGPTSATPPTSSNLSPFTELPLAEPLRADSVLPPDPLTSREVTGLMLVADWRWSEIPSPPRIPEVSPEGLAAARRLTSFKWLIAATENGRLRILFDTRPFPLPLGSELRARADRLGHLLIFPGGKEYRAAPPGSLRALFGDRRLDVLPLSPGEVTPRPPPAARGRLISQRTEVASRVGSVVLDTVSLPEPNLGVALLCRLLLELIAVDPTLPLCASGLLPVRAQFTWRSGSGITFEVQEYSRRMELPVGEVTCPPFGAQMAATMVPPQPSGVLLTREESAAFRLRPAEVVVPGKDAPAEGFVARNATDGLRYLLVDGVPAAWVLPGEDAVLPGFPRGRYMVQWRTFLGDRIEAPKLVEAPARIAVGEPPPEPLPATSLR